MDPGFGEGRGPTQREFQGAGVERDRPPSRPSFHREAGGDAKKFIYENRKWTETFSWGDRDLWCRVWNLGFGAWGLQLGQQDEVWVRGGRRQRQGASPPWIHPGPL